MPGVCFVGSADGGFVFPRFLPAFDAVAALVQTFSLLARSARALSGVVGELPEVFMAREGAVTPWEKKGMVMRSVMEQGRQVDGARRV